MREDSADAAREQKSISSACSGLITPSLDEMVHVAKEMQRAGFHAAAADRRRHHRAMHTAVKIAPHYPQPVVYVKDASRGVGVASNLLSD